MSLRWSQSDVDQYLRRGQPAPLSEQAFLAAVVKIARTSGFLSYHTYRSTKSVEGFPDLVLASKTPGKPLYVCELKREEGHLTLAQQAWLTALAGCTGVVSAVWRPSAMDTIVAQLRR